MEKAQDPPLEKATLTFDKELFDKALHLFVGAACLNAADSDEIDRRVADLRAALAAATIPAPPSRARKEDEMSKIKVQHIEPGDPELITRLRPEDLSPVSDHDALLAGRGVARLISRDELRCMFPDPADY